MGVKTPPFFMEKQLQTDRKITLLKEIEYSNDFDFVSSVLLEWAKLKKNKTVDKVISAHNRMYYFTFNIQEEVRIMRQIISEYRADKNRAIERARKAEEKITDLEQTLKKYIKL